MAHVRPFMHRIDILVRARIHTYMHRYTHTHIRSTQNVLGQAGLLTAAPKRQ